METLQQRIATRFLERLEDAKFDGDKIRQIRDLLIGNKKPKADDFVKIFSPPADGDVR